MDIPHQLGLLVPAKIAPPQPSAALVVRDRLLARLAGSATTRLTLVIAPAGYGKTTLVAQWLGTVAHQVAWLTLDEHDQDGLQFMAYLAGAIERVFPEALTATRPLLVALEPPPLYVLLQALLVDLSALPGGLTLVLDDYHTIAAASVHQAVAYLLRQLPHNCRLVIASRIDPPLSVTRLRAERQLTEIRTAELRFTDAEASALVGTLLGRAPDVAQLASLQLETEGWAIALQLAGLAALDSPRPARSPRLLRPIEEYLVEEVLHYLPTATQQTLLALAVPERICAGLAAALLGPQEDHVHAEDVLEQLVRANLLLVPLETERRWYRFHHLFRDLLLRRLLLTAGKTALGELQGRAAEWLASEGLYEEAVRCYLAAGQEEAAGALVERLLAPELGRGLTATRPYHWLRLLPRPLIERRPGLTLLEARMGFATLNFAVMASSLAQIESLLAAQPPSAPAPWQTFPADLTLLRGALAYVQRRLEDALPALELVLGHELGLSLTGQGVMVLGRMYVAAGRYQEGVRRIEAAREMQQGIPGSVYELSCSAALCGMHGLGGSIDALEQEATRLANTIAASNAGDYWICYAAANLGRSAYERSDLPLAARQFAAVVERRYHTNTAVTIGSLIGLALISALRGDFEAANNYAQETQALAIEVGSPFARNEALGCAARLAFAQNDLETALRLVEEITPDPFLGSSSWHAMELPQLTKATVLLAAGNPEQLRGAETAITNVLGQVEAQHNMRPMVCALALLAQLREAQGRSDEALYLLERAVDLAVRHGYLRALADRAPGLSPLLSTLAARGIQRAYIEHVLAAADAGFSLEMPRLAPRTSTAGSDMLTSREMEILALLAERWSDKEIAARLVITLNTVRKHTSTVYDKLGVSNRREAVMAARSLGLLPSV